jgi:hypothetical protein
MFSPPQEAALGQGILLVSKHIVFGSGITTLIMFSGYQTSVRDIPTLRMSLYLDHLDHQTSAGGSIGSRDFVG